MTELVEPVVVLGLNGKIYYDSAGTYSTPTWVACPSVKDVTLNIEATEADVTTRGNGGWEAIAPGLFKGSIDFDLVWSKKADTNALPTDVQKFLDKFLARGMLDVLIMDGAYDVAGNQGLRAEVAVTKFTRQEAIGESMRVSVTIKPTLAAHAPSWFVGVAP